MIGKLIGYLSSKWEFPGMFMWLRIQKHWKPKLLSRGLVKCDALVFGCLSSKWEFPGISTWLRMQNLIVHIMVNHSISSKQFQEATIGITSDHMHTDMQLLRYQNFLMTKESGKGASDDATYNLVQDNACICNILKLHSYPSNVTIYSYIIIAVPCTCRCTCVHVYTSKTRCS